VETIAYLYSPQQPPSISGFGDETSGRNLQGGDQDQAVLSPANDTSFVAPPESLSNSMKVGGGEDEEDIWGSADNDLGFESWTQQIARNPKDFSVADNATVGAVSALTFLFTLYFSDLTHKMRQIL
jgi:hypothetical protein